MIEINLLPGSGKRTTRRLPRLSFKRSAPKLESPGTPRDRWALFALLGWVVGPLMIAWLFMGTSSAKADLEVSIEGARLDSTRYAEMRAANAVLLARQDTIAQKLQLIQQVDAGRFVWSHIVDEVSRAVPQYTWLVNIFFVSGDAQLSLPKFVIDGRTGNTFSLTQFMQDLEASPFIRNVTLIQTDQVREKEKMLYTFALQCEYQEPTPDMIKTVPIFIREGD